MSSLIDLSGIAILDHHCHTLLRPGAPLVGDGFRRFFAETTDPRMAAHIQHTVFYMRMLRDVAALFGCASSEEAVLDLRAAMPPEDYARRLFDAGNFRALLVDTGFRGPDSYELDQLSQIVGRPVERIIRLETLMEQLIVASATFGQVEDALRAELRMARARRGWAQEHRGVSWRAACRAAHLRASGGGVPSAERDRPALWACAPG